MIPCPHHGSAYRTDCRACVVCQSIESALPGSLHSGATQAQAVTRKTDCIHLGTKLDGPSTCRGKCWHACEAGHGADGRARPGIECQLCPHYDADGPIDQPTGEPFAPARRHLLYHLLPVTGNGMWQRNLDMLIARMPLFDGKRVVAICTGEVNDTRTLRGKFALDHPDAVREYLRGHDCEFIERPNDPNLREVVTWGPLWQSVAEFAATDDVVFYAQAKGVTHPVNPGVAVHHWTRMLYSSLLDFWPIVEEQLSHFPITGSFKKVGAGFDGSKSKWHYSGAFFWIRAREAFANRRVESIDRHWWGNEAFPGLHWSPDDAGCVFMDGKVPTLDLYAWKFTTKIVLPQFQEWCKANADRRTQWEVAK